MAIMSLAKKITKPVIIKSSTTMDSSLLSDKIVYASFKHYNEEEMINHLPLSRLRSILKKIRLNALDDLKHLKENARSNDSLEVISALGFIIDNNELFESIELYLIEDKFSLCDAICEAISDSEGTIEKYYLNPNDKIFLLLLTEQIAYIEDRLCSYARRFLFEEFSKTIDTAKIIVIQSFFKEIFYGFNSNIKGIIYRDKSKSQSIAHYSINFQIPIIQSDIELLGRKKIVIITHTQEIICEPKKGIIDKYHQQNQAKDIIYSASTAILGKKYRLYATISNPDDMTMVVNNPWYKGIIFKPEYLLAAKGSPLTKDEWIKHLQVIEQNSNHRSIIYRLPAFDQAMTTEDFNGECPNKESVYRQHSYYHNYLAAIAYVMKDVKSTLSIHVPFVKIEKDMHEWSSFIKLVLDDHDYTRDIRIGFDLDFQSTIQDNVQLRHSNNVVFHIDTIMADYVTNFRTYYDRLSLKLFKDSHAYADIISAIQYFKHHYKEVRPFFMGHYMMSYEMFRRVLRAGYRNFCIHPAFLHQLIPIITTHVESRGKFIGLFQFNKERSLYYEELRKKLGPDAVIELGTYKKMLAEKEKNKDKK